MEMATGSSSWGVKAEGTSQAVASVKVAALGVVVAVVLSLLFSSRFPALTLLPALVINCGFLQITVLHGLIFSLIQFPWMYLWSLPLRWAFGLPVVFSYLFTYTPILLILLRPRHDRHGALGRFFIRYIWDPPLMACIYLVAHLGLDGGRFMTPFATHIDDTIVVGSLPLPHDVRVLWEVHRVGAVVNMTEEYHGPVVEYESVGIQQLRLPTVDTTSPSLEAVSAGVEFIAEFTQRNPGKKVFIHCKGGRGRAATMALCWYLKQDPSKHPTEVVRMLKSKRHVVSTAVAKYETVTTYHQMIAREGGGTTTPTGTS